MAEQKDVAGKEAAEKLYAFVVEQIKAGADRATIVQKMVDSGASREEAAPLIDTLHAAIMKTAKEQEFTTDALVPAGFGGLLAAVAGGAVWGVVAIATSYELGYLAWGLGVVSGYAVVYFAKGRRGIQLQAIAVAASVLGIVIGKYVTFFHYLRQVVEKRQGAEAAGSLSPFSESVLQIFLENISVMLSGFDALWVILAVLSAWRIPKSLGITVPRHYIPQ